MAVDNKKAKRKPGGGRKPSKPDYNPSAILQNQMDAAVSLYDKEEHPSLQTIADELDLNPIKVRKLLITAGVYRSEVADQVNRVFNQHRAWARANKRPTEGRTAPPGHRQTTPPRCQSPTQGQRNGRVGKGGRRFSFDRFFFARLPIYVPDQSANDCVHYPLAILRE